MKKIITLTLITLSSMALSSCGGGSCPTTTQVLALDAICNDANDMSNYTPIQSGDIITQEMEDTVINVLHNQDNQKVACLKSGQASIIRAI